MKRILTLAFVMSLILSSYSISDCQALSAIPSEDPLVRLSYTSRDRVGTTVFESGATLWGDHVLLNATFCSADESVTASRLSLITDEGENFTILSDNSTVICDTYQIGKNVTVSIQFSVTLKNSTRLSFHYDSIGINNFFRPYLSSIFATGSGRMKTIQWSLIDLNADDNHIFDVYLRNDENTRWWLLAANVTDSFFDWNSTFYTPGIWRVRVEAFDNDTTFRPSSSGNIPIWPGLSNSLESSRFSWSRIVDDFGSIPGSNVTCVLLSGTWSEYEQGTTGNSITWMKKASMFDAYPDLTNSIYAVYRNNTIVLEGSISYGYIEAALDSLSVGLYNFTLYLTHRNFSVRSTAFVNIVPQDAGAPGSPMVLGMFIVLLGSIIGVALYCLRNTSQKELT